MITQIPRTYIIECIRNIIQDVGRADVTDIEARVGMGHAEVTTTYRDGSEKSLNMWASFEDPKEEVIYGMKINWDGLVDDDGDVQICGTRVDIPTVRMCVENFAADIDEEDTVYTAIHIREDRVTLIREDAWMDELSYHKHTNVRKFFATQEDAKAYKDRGEEARDGETCMQAQRA